MPDRAHHGRGRVRDGPDELLAAERQQVLEGASAAGDDDDVDHGVGVELPQCSDHLGYGGVALDRYFADLEFDGRPAQGSIAEHILLGVRVAAGDQADPVREQGEPLFAGIGKEPFGGEGLAQPLDPGEEVAEAHGPDVLHGHVQPARLEPKFGLDQGYNPGTAFQRGGLAVQHGGPDRCRQRDFGVDVPECQVGVAATPVELDYLPLNPRRGRAVDMHLELLGQQLQRPGVVRTGLGRGGR